jgi:hypothetical protein
VSVENVNPHDELSRLDEQIQSATELAALKPIYFRLNEILQAFPGDFDIQFTGNDVKQHLMDRGKLLKQQEIAPPPPLPSWRELVASAPAPPVAPLPLSSPFSEPAPPEPPEPALEATSEYPPPPPAPVPAPAPPAPPFRWNRAVVIAPVAALLLILALGLWLVHKRNADIAARRAAVAVDIATNPPGASVQMLAGGQTQAGCTSNCKLALKPGTYQVIASLDGFMPATGTVTVTPRQPASLSLSLHLRPPSVRLLTDLDHGQVVVDDRPPAQLEEGQWVFDNVPPGAHTVKVTGPDGDASFSFTVADAQPPAVTGPVNARNMIAVLVASLGKQARVVTSGGPWKLTVNGQPQPDAGPSGADLTGFQPGVNEIVLGEGKDQRNMSDTFAAAPTLTAFLKTDVNAGTVIVSTGQDDVRVYLNDKEYHRRTQRGQLRVPALGKVVVRVAKSGFEDVPAQTVEVNKGAEVRLQFDLKPRPQVASLEIEDAVPGTEVFIDQRNAGAVGSDGSFSLSPVPPGEHLVELRRDMYLPKRIEQSFRPGQAVVLAGAEVVLAAARGAIHLTRTPPSATITYRRNDETESHEAHGNQLELPAGSYVFSATAPGFAEASTRVQLAAGESHEVDFTLVPRPVPPPPPVLPRGMTDFEDAQTWKKEGNNWVHTGGGFVPYKPRPDGVFTFTAQLLKGGGAFRAGQIRWCLQYLDARNYLLYEMDRKVFWAGVIQKGKRYERVKSPLNFGNQKAFTIQIEVTPDRLVQKVRAGNEWKVLDTFVEPGRDFTQGKFGFLVQGNDEIAISDFKFVPK